MDHEVLAHLLLVLILRLVGGSLGDLPLVGLSLLPVLDVLLLLPDGGVEVLDPLLSVCLLVAHVLHQVVKHGPRLQIVLLALSTAVDFLCVNRLFRVQTLLQLFLLKAVGDEVFVHAADHVFVDVDAHLLLLELGLRGVDALLDLVQARTGFVNGVLRLVLLRVQTLNFLLHTVQVVLHVHDLLLHNVVLLFELRQLT